MVGMMRGQVNESHGVGGCSRGWLAKNRQLNSLTGGVVGMAIDAIQVKEIDCLT